MCDRGGYYLSRVLPAYLGYETVDALGKAVTYEDEGQQKTVWTFCMPYDILSGISFDPDDKAINKNSIWQCTVKEMGTGKVICKYTFFQSGAEQDSLPLRFDYSMSVKIGKERNWYTDRQRKGIIQELY